MALNSKQKLKEHCAEKKLENQLKTVIKDYDLLKNDFDNLHITYANEKKAHNELKEEYLKLMLEKEELSKKIEENQQQQSPISKGKGSLTTKDCLGEKRNPQESEQTTGTTNIQESNFHVSIIPYHDNPMLAKPNLTSPSNCVLCISMLAC